MKRVSAPERTRERLRALIDGRLGTAPDRSNLVLLAAQLILEEALEGEVRDEIGRDRYERAGGDASGYRNGYRTGRMKTAEGMVEYAAPQVRETAEPFVSSIRQNLAGRTGALEDLAVELYARGLSTRDIEDAFTDEAGRRLLSRAAVSEITERLWAEYEAFTTRDLGEHRVVYLFVDGIAERLRAGQPREPVLAAWGIGEDGRKVLLHLMAGSKEDTETVRAFFQDMRGRGLAIHCSSSPTAPRGSSGRSRSAFRARHDSAVWRIACATSPSRSRPTCGPSSRHVRARATRPRPGPSPATSPWACGLITVRCCRVRWRASRMTLKRALRTCGSR
jgi:Transposase, Mutator family